MATSSQVASLSDTEKETEQSEAEESRRSEMWTPLIDEIKSLVDALHDLDNDETKSLDIISEHSKRIKDAMPSEPLDIWYPKPIHRLLSIHPLKRIEIPLKILELLVSSGFNVNEHYEDSTNDEENTCLLLAVENHHYNAVRWLVQHNADRDTCKMRAKRKALPKVPSSSDSDSDLECFFDNDYDDITPIAMLAAQKDAPLDIFNTLKTSENMNGNPERKSVLPLHVAIEHGHVSSALHLIELGASVNQKDCEGNLPLQVAVANGHTELAQSLIKHGSSVSQGGMEGDLPLHLALSNDNTELALFLMSHGASVNEEDWTGNLPLHLAVSNGNIELALSIIKHGASVNEKDRRGDSPLHLATDHTELAFSLIEHGASVNQENNVGHLPISYYVESDMECFNDELFVRLMPERSVGIKTICALLATRDNDQKVCRREVLSTVLHQLIQHLILDEPLSMKIETENAMEYAFLQMGIEVDMYLNENVIASNMDSLRAVYLCSVLLILMESDACYSDNLVGRLASHALDEDKYHAQAIDDLWKAYNQKHTVKKLQTVCVQRTRQSMRSLTDESFQSLQVPSCVCKLLMLHDVADVLCEAYLMWPECMAIDDFM